MKTVLIITSAIGALVQVLGVDYSVDPRLSQAVIQCVTTTGVNPAHVQHLAVGQYDDDPKLNDFLVCNYRKFGILDQKGNVDLLALQSALINVMHINNKHVVEEIVRSCSKKTGWDPQETALEMYKCAYEIIKDNGISWRQ